MLQLGCWPKQSHERQSWRPDREAYTLQVPAHKICGSMEFQSSTGIHAHELESVQKQTKECAIVTYRRQAIASITADILHDGAVGMA